MAKNLLNPYRLKKKLKRGIERTSLFSGGENDSSGKDFAWRKSSNPFRQHTINWRRRLYVFFTLFFLLATISMVFFHPFFQIKNISGQGLQRIDTQEFISSINGIIDYKKLFFLPGRSYFLVNTDEVEVILEKKYPLDSITISKNFPDGLTFVAEEKISTVIYDNGQTYSYIGLDGQLVETILNVNPDEWQEIRETVTSTHPETGEEFREEKVIERLHTPNVSAVKMQMGDYPIIYDHRQQGTAVNTSVLKPETIKATIDWFNYLQKRVTIPFSYLTLENELRDATIKTGEGWQIYIRLDEAVEPQMENLDFLLREKINRSSLKYIDLRYGKKVYWQ